MSLWALRESRLATYCYGGLFAQAVEGTRERPFAPMRLTATLPREIFETERYDCYPYPCHAAQRQSTEVQILQLLRMGYDVRLLEPVECLIEKKSVRNRI